MELMKAILWSYDGKRVTEWHHIINNVVHKELVKIRNRKGCPLAPFIYHMYTRYGALRTRKHEEWTRRQRMEDTEPCVDPEPTQKEEYPDREVIDLEELPEPAQMTKKAKKLDPNQAGPSKAPRPPTIRANWVGGATPSLFFSAQEEKEEKEEEEQEREEEEEEEEESTPLLQRTRAQQKRVEEVAEASGDQSEDPDDQHEEEHDGNESG